jgi:hypothetical protein
MDIRDWIPGLALQSKGKLIEVGKLAIVELLVRF